MARVSELRTNFVSGELTPLVSNRVEFDRYFSGSEILENFDILPQGPIFRRKGFKYIAETKNSSKVRLVPFIFSGDQKYCIEFGSGYARFFTENGRVLEATKTITGFTNADPMVFTVASHGYSNGDFVEISVDGLEAISGKTFEVSNVTTNTFKIDFDGTNLNVFANTINRTVGKVFEISTDYTLGNIFNLSFAQINDLMFLASAGKKPKKLTRLAVNNFELVDIDFLYGPYQDENIVSTDLVALSSGSPWTEGSTGTLTASGGHTPFLSSQVGSLFRIRSGTDHAFLKITAYTSSTVVTVTFQKDIPTPLRTGTHFTWSQGEFRAGNYPVTLAIFEQRLVFAGTPNSPQRLWFSKSNEDYTNFEAGVVADDAFIVSVASRRGDPIKWLFADDVLFAGTSNGIFRITSSNNSSAVKPDDIDVKINISYGCSDISPQLVGSSVVYMQKGNRIVRSVAYSLASDKYLATYLNIDSEHITKSTIVQTEYQQDPISTFLMIREDGEIVKMTQEQDQNILNFCRTKTNGLFESIAVLENSDANDIIFASVQRNIGGNTKRFIELQTPNFEVTDLNRDFVDCYKVFSVSKLTSATLTETTATLGNISVDAGFIWTYDDIGKQIHEVRGTGKALITSISTNKIANITTISAFSSATLDFDEYRLATNEVVGLEYLEGQEVQINYDGATHPNKTVTDGKISIDDFSSIIFVGLGYTSIQKNMPIEVLALRNSLGYTIHKEVRIDRLNLTFQDTSGGQIITNERTFDMPERSTFNNMNETTPLFSGNKEIIIGTNWDQVGQIQVIQSQPQPMTLKSISYKTTVNDK